MSEESGTARRLTDAARARLNELLASGTPLAAAMKQLASLPGAFEEASASKLAERPARKPWQGDSTDWESVPAKLRTLRELDAARVVFGAETHDHALAPTLSEARVLALEKKLAISLPPGLRAFYTHVGNGGAGPGYGLYGSVALKRRRPAVAYPGVAALRQRGGEQPANELAANCTPYSLSGLLIVGTHGCGIFTAVVCTGDVGRVVSFDADGVSESERTLRDVYVEWLDDELARFELLQRLHAAGASQGTMVDEMRALLPRDRAFTAASEVETKLRSLLIRRGPSSGG